MAHHRRKTSRLHATRKTSWTSFNRRLAEKGETFHAGRRGWRFYDYDTPTRWDLMKHVRPARRTISSVSEGRLSPNRKKPSASSRTLVAEPSYWPWNTSATSGAANTATSAR